MKMKMKTLMTLTGGVIALSIAGAPSVAQQTQPPSPSSGGMTTPQQSNQAPSKALEGATQAQQQVDMLSAEGKRLVGKQVIGQNDEKIGEVSDVVVGPDGKVSAVLMESGGVMGIGAKTVALPLQQLKPEGDRIIASGLTKQQAEALPEFDKDRESQQQRQGG